MAQGSPQSPHPPYFHATSGKRGEEDNKDHRENFPVTGKVTGGGGSGVGDSSGIPVSIPTMGDDTTTRLQKELATFQQKHDSLEAKLDSKYQQLDAKLDS
ncbi:hypothetical protein COLO4_21302 [Corchorus olitorius]|uniref:Uncharacterized protein n=1 Tax=Corchorus olitorius TaxID=93759 RepID=A0A1R3IU52_9ROSI|nr:hypothetical protein COLO4_21302 [Corchorus olitorius]